MGRSEEARRIPTDEVVQPDEDRLNKLRRAVTFPTEALTAQFLRLGLDVDALAPLTLDVGTTSPAEFNIEQLPVRCRPILRVDGSYVLIAPSSLPAALTHAILSRASECGDLPVVAERLREATFGSVDRSLELLGCYRLSGPEMSHDPAFPATRALYSIDIDKVLALVLLTNPLQDFDPTTIDSDWSPENLGERVTEEMLAIEDRMAIAGNPSEWRTRTARL